MQTNGFSIKSLKVKLLAGEQKATERWLVPFIGFHPSQSYRIWSIRRNALWSVSGNSELVVCVCLSSLKVWSATVDEFHFAPVASVLQYSQGFIHPNWCRNLSSTVRSPLLNGNLSFKQKQLHFQLPSRWLPDGSAQALRKKGLPTGSLCTSMAVLFCWVALVVDSVVLAWWFRHLPHSRWEGTL